jgi:hypothetical protein
MRLYLGAALAIAGVGVYTWQGGFRAEAELSPEQPPREVNATPTAPYTRPILPTVNFGEPADQTGRVPVMRQGAQVGWVKPDPARLHASAPAARPVPTTARAPRGPKVSSATSTSTHTVHRGQVGTVARIRSDFHQILDRNYFKRSASTRRLNDFRDDRSRRWNR